MTKTESLQLPIEFRYYGNGSAKYQAAFLENNLLQNEKGLYLSRIAKKNGKHRYYLTSETKTYTCDVCDNNRCRSMYCRGHLIYDCHYTSVYIGKDINNALNDNNLSANNFKQHQ